MTATYNGVSKSATQTISITAASSENPDNPDNPDNPSDESKITITYSSSHGNTPSSKSYDKTDSGYTLTADDLPALTETGYIFGGWTKEVVSTGVGGEASPTVTTTTDTGSITIVKAGDTITENTTLYAIWTAITYTVEFDANGGSGEAVSGISAAYDVEFDVPANSFTYDGYNASANTWNTSKDGSGTTLIAGNKAKNLTAENGATVTLYAIWIEKGAHSITYLDSDGTTAISGMSPVTFKETEAVDLSKAVPEKAGYTFAGWSESVVSAGSTIPDAGSTTTTVTGWKAGEKTSDVTLYAVWTANTNTAYTVKHFLQPVSLSTTLSDYEEQTSDAQTLTGTTGAQTSASAKTYAGFTAKEITQGTIAGDGSTVVLVYYDRNTITLTFDTDGGSYIASISGKYGTKVTAPENPTKNGYTFAGWVVSTGVGGEASPTVTTTELPTTFPAENATYKATWTVAKTASYTVKHFLQPVSLSTTLSDYEEQTSDAQTLTGNTGEKTSAAAKTYAGFTAKEITQGTIAANGSTVVSVYYDRKEITLTFDTDGGSTVSSITGKYGTAVTAPENPTKTGYTFAGWVVSTGSTTTELPATFPSENATYKATWTEDSDYANLKVTHLLQKLSEDGTSVLDEYEVYDEYTARCKIGIYSYQGPEVMKLIPGFTYGVCEQYNNDGKVAADGSSWIIEHYNRIDVTFTLNLDGGSGTESITGKYGTKVVAPENPTRAGYTFAGWTPELPDTYPTDDASFTATWAMAETASYTVKHFLQPVSLSTTLSDYEEQASDVQTFTGKTGATTSANAKTYTGFTAQTIKQETIAPDGSTVVSIYYDRNTVTLSFDSDGGSEVAAISGKYGTAVTAPENPTKTGYTFAGWGLSTGSTTTELPSTFPTSDESYKATWTANTNTAYTVKHFLQNVALTGYEEQTSDTQTLTGTTDAETSAAAKTYAGFTAKEITQGTIAADGSTVVSVYYDRNEITLTLDLDGGSGTESIKGKYGTAVTAPANPTRDGYTFMGWTPELPKEFSSSATYTATWKVGIGSISASAPTYSSVDLEVTADSTTDASKITFTAKDGLTSYAWYVDGARKSTESTFTMSISDYNAGSYTVMLVSGKNSVTVEVAVSK